MGTVWHNLWHNLRKTIPDQFPLLEENGGIAWVWWPQVAKVVGETGCESTFPTTRKAQKTADLHTLVGACEPACDTS